MWRTVIESRESLAGLERVTGRRCWRCLITSARLTSGEARFAARRLIQQLLQPLFNSRLLQRSFNGYFNAR
jgi:hypothetical protein